MKRRYPLAVFLGAFLLFLVQPMAGKRVLPRFGGGPSVWTACMLFFQVLLLGGYAYAHGLTSRLSRRMQGRLHSGLLVLGVLALGLFARSETWTSHGAGSDDPVRAILTVLIGAVGLPYFLLAATGPLLQAWFHADSFHADSFHADSSSTGSSGSSVYRLYALSNIASFLALLCYPVAVEPWLALQNQTWMWAGIFVVYAATMIYCGLAGGGETQHADEAKAAGAPIAWTTMVFWLALAACGSVILLGATNHICQEVAVIPFLWVVPLSIYLLTFVLCFESEGWYNRRLFALLASMAIAFSCYLVGTDSWPAWMNRLPLIGEHLPKPQAVWLQGLTDLVIVAAGCMICHGELARSKPEPSRLTQFYLALSAGGALGGVFTAIVAPRVFHSFIEFPMAMTACCLLAVAGWWRSGIFTDDPPQSKAAAFSNYVAVFALVAAATSGVLVMLRKPDEKVVMSTRNFFGVLKVSEDEEDGGQILKLTHGRTLHGLQFQDAERRDLPTTYYGPDSGVGIALINHPRRFAEPRTLKIGVIGLGAGTISAWGKKGDTIRFYEINPSVDTISNHYFTYRKDSPAHVDFVLGDARVRLEDEFKRGESQQFDLLAVDAFSSDAIPVHLLTKECGDLYKYHLKPDGLLLLHISNRWLDLKPPSRGLADHLGWRAGLIDSDDESGPGIRSSTWVAVGSPNNVFWKEEAVSKAISEWSKTGRQPLLWRDDFTSLLPVFDW